ncbi:Nif3-like dinuclear metal center hexameric protein [Listeria ilorinensis]|uniref:Nif3-like dinuclear metal center hexameric protein n=1 Tax=Listeria ilorinensis TaxID=2867439 RepID=UPI001EF485E2|nr:Nif3-like dinuclear metal center hexameric protein [Listeria ilorinensis]
MKTANGYEYAAMLEEIAPRKYAMEGDPIGLQLGDLSKKVRKIMFTLDVLEEVVEEAIEEKVDMIIAHHPFLFHPIKQIDMSTSQGRMIRKLIKHDIIVYAAHTNLDIARGGVNDLLAKELELSDCQMIVPTWQEQYVKIAVYVPELAQEQIRLALVENGAGEIGTDYSNCTFSTKGIGRFQPAENANPAIGKRGELTEVTEIKLEAVAPKSKMNEILKAVRNAHPYEEAAIDVYQLAHLHEQEGLGRIGQLQKEVPMDVFIDRVKSALAIENVRFIGKNLQQPVKKVAIIGGDGNKFIHDVKRSGADVYITGDIYYHTGHDLLALDLPTIDAGHNIEKIMKTYLKRTFKKKAVERDYEVGLMISEKNTDPFQFL